MWCGIVTLFPEMFKALTDYGITRRAVERRLLELHYWDPRDFATDPHQSVDDRPYGGGPGMVMGVYPLRHAIIAAKEAAGAQAKVIYYRPKAKSYRKSELDKPLLTQRDLFLSRVDTRVLMNGSSLWKWMKNGPSGIMS